MRGRTYNPKDIPQLKWPGLVGLFVLPLCWWLFILYVVTPLLLPYVTTPEGEVNGYMSSLVHSLTYKGANPITEGLRLGVVVGLLWVFPHGLAMASTHGTSIIYEINNAIWHMVEQGIGGVIVALVYGRRGFGAKSVFSSSI